MSNHGNTYGAVWPRCTSCGIAVHPLHPDRKDGPMVTPDVHPVCVLHPADDDAARLARVDAAADRQAHERQPAGRLQALAAECCYSEDGGFDAEDNDLGSVDALINYKDALERALLDAWAR